MDKFTDTFLTQMGKRHVGYDSNDEAIQRQGPPRFINPANDWTKHIISGGDDTGQLGIMAEMRLTKENLEMDAASVEDEIKALKSYPTYQEICKSFGSDTDDEIANLVNEYRNLTVEGFPEYLQHIAKKASKMREIAEDKNYNKALAFALMVDYDEHLIYMKAKEPSSTDKRISYGKEKSAGDARKQAMDARERQFEQHMGAQEKLLKERQSLIGNRPQQTPTMPLGSGPGLLKKVGDVIGNHAARFTSEMLGNISSDSIKKFFMPDENHPHFGVEGKTAPSPFRQVLDTINSNGNIDPSHSHNPMVHHAANFMNAYNAFRKHAGPMLAGMGEGVHQLANNLSTSNPGLAQILTGVAGHMKNFNPADVGINQSPEARAAVTPQTQTAQIDPQADQDSRQRNRQRYEDAARQAGGGENTRQAGPGYDPANNSDPITKVRPIQPSREVTTKSLEDVFLKGFNTRTSSRTITPWVGRND